MISAERVRLQFPSFYSESYSRLLSFVAAYYEWLTSGISRDGEVQAVGMMGSFLPAVHLDRESRIFTASDGSYIKGTDGRYLAATSVNEQVVDQWLTQLGFPDAENFLGNVYQDGLDYVKVDTISFIRLLNDIWKLRGTPKGIELLFKIFFNETVTVLYPRVLLAAPDEGLICDGFSESVVRDDVFWNEYSIVVTVEQETKYYEEFINTVYNPFFHPSGFLLTLEEQFVVGEITTHGGLHTLVHTTLVTELG